MCPSFECVYLWEQYLLFMILLYNLSIVYHLHYSRNVGKFYGMKMAMKMESSRPFWIIYFCFSVTPELFFVIYCLVSRCICAFVLLWSRDENNFFCL